MIQPIETRYAGCLFRSRLEARWAVFFDALGIAWEYEPEGYALDEETWYLPDFLLPTFNVWCEVKPVGGDFALAKRFATMLKVHVWLCEGTPALRLYELYFPPTEDSWAMYAYPCPYKKRMWYEFPGPDDIRQEYSEETWPYGWHDAFFHAVRQARSARFEHFDKGIRYAPLDRR